MKMMDVEVQQPSVTWEDPQMIDPADPVLRKVVDVIKGALCFRHAQITAETNFAEDLDIDSLDLITTFVDMEEDLGITFPDDAPSRFVRVADIVLYLKKKASAEAPPAGMIG